MLLRTFWRESRSGKFRRVWLLLKYVSFLALLKDSTDTYLVTRSISRHGTNLVNLSSSSFPLLSHPLLRIAFASRSPLLTPTLSSRPPQPSASTRLPRDVSPRTFRPPRFQPQNSFPPFSFTFDPFLLDMPRRRFRPVSRHCAAPSTLASISESPTSTTNLLISTLLPRPDSSSASALLQPTASTHHHQLPSSQPRLQSNSKELLPYSDSDKRVLQAKKRAASETVEWELQFFGKVRRIEELKTYLQGIVDAAPEKRGDQLLIDWKEEWIDLLRKSSQTDYAIEVIKRQVRPAEQAVGRGEKVRTNFATRSLEAVLIRYSYSIAYRTSSSAIQALYQA